MAKPRMNCSSGPIMADTCWDGYKADGLKPSPSGKKTSGGKTKMVNNCVPE